MLDYRSNRQAGNDQQPENKHAHQEPKGNAIHFLRLSCHVL